MYSRRTNLTSEQAGKGWTQRDSRETMANIIAGLRFGVLTVAEAIEAIGIMNGADWLPEEQEVTPLEP